MTGGPFEHYPATAGSIDSAGQDLNGSATPVRAVAHDAAVASARAASSSDGTLFPLISALGDPLWQQGDALHQAAAWAGSIVRAWSLSVEGYDEQIDQLNQEYAEAKATSFGVTEPEMRGGQTADARETMWDQYGADVSAAGAAKLAELRRRKNVLDDDLDRSATDLAGRLDRCPTQADWQAFDELGILPDSFREYLPPLPEEPEEDHENRLWSLFKTFVFDPTQCGGGGSIFGCGIEVAGIIPVGKVLKGGKLVKKGIDAVEGAEDVAKHADEVIDVVKAADKAEDAAAAGLKDLFKDGTTPKATELRDYAEKQGWELRQNPNGPPKYVDENGVTRVTIKQGSPRTPGSEHPHAEMRDSSGQRVDGDGNPVNKNDPGNHTPIDWDLD